MRTVCLLLTAVVLFTICDMSLLTVQVLIFWIMKVSLHVYLIIFGIIPIVFHYSYAIQKMILFLNFVQWPLYPDFSKPESVGMKGARNFYITTDQQIKIGLWQILPQYLLNQSIPITDEAFEAELANAERPVFLYMHGNSGNRASSHRVELYKLFQSLDCHVICFDYRNYGDSQLAEISETGVVADSKYILQWVMNKVNGTAPVFVWGHSLGTGVSTHVLASLAAEDIVPAGLFLESPFNNIADELSEHPFAQVFKHLPWFHWAIVEPFYHNNLRFESDKHIKNVKCPIMILHAEDDNVVPFSLGEKLYQAAIKYHGNETDHVHLVRIESSHGLGHKYICRYQELPNIITSFMAQVRYDQNE